MEHVATVVADKRNGCTIFAVLNAEYEYALRDSRDEESERLLLMMNNADQPRTVEIDISDTVLSQSRTLTRVWADNDASLEPGPKISATLPPRSLSIYAIQ